MTANLKQYFINKNHIDINPDNTGSAKLSVEVNTKINQPKSKEDAKTAHFKLNVNINSVENDMIAIALGMDCLFEFDAPPKKI